MTSLLLLFVAFASAASDDTYVWTEWSNAAKCTRRCSKSYGSRLYWRECMKCVDTFCKPVHHLYCDGHEEKTELCYVGSQCFGQGTYRGQWTEWTNSGLCPSVGEHCTGEKVVSFRRCILPAAYQRRSMTFRCPGDQSVKKVEPCPCEVSVWSEWSEWTLCPPSGTGTRNRKRVCIKRNDVECTGAPVEESPCLGAATICCVGRSRLRKVRSSQSKERPRHGKLSADMMDVVIACVIVSILLIVLCLIAIVTYHRRKAAKKEKEAKQEKTPLMPMPPRAVPSAPPLSPAAVQPRLVPSTPPHSHSPLPPRIVPSAPPQSPAAHPP